MVQREIKIKEWFNSISSHTEAVKFIKFFKSYGFILLLVVAISFAVYIRAESMQLRSTERWAEDTIHSQIRAQIQAEALAKYPNLPASNLASYINEQYNTFITAQKSQIDAGIKDTADYFKSQLSNAEGLPYMSDIDTYFWARFSDNILEHGYAGDYKKEFQGKLQQWDSHMLAPSGRPVPPDIFHAYFQAYIANFVNVFNPGLNPEWVYMNINLLLVGLAVIPAFFIGRRLGGNIAGFFSGLLIAMHPVILTRTLGGVSDTDAYQILFPLVILWTFLLAFDAEARAKKIFYGILTGALIGLYSKVWGGWYFALGLIVLASGCYTLYEIIKGWKEYKIKVFFKDKNLLNVYIEIGTIFLSAIIVLYLFSGSFLFFNFISGFFHFSSLHEIGDVWPNVYTTVAEQNEGSFAVAVSQLGGNMMYAFAIVGILSTFYLTKKRTGKMQIQYFIFMLAWMLLGSWAAVRGIRFILLAAPPFAIGIGLGISFIVIVFKKFCSMVNMKGTLVAPAVFIGAIFFLGIFPYSTSGLWKSSQNIALSNGPMMNDAWYDSLIKIRDLSESNAIVNSWWDFGHWFKYEADRAVTFDGTSQNTPMAYWIGKVLSTNDESQAVGILRMLDCGSFLAGNTLVDAGYDKAQAADILSYVADENHSADDVQSLMREKYAVPEPTIAIILQQAKCSNPPENYFITSEDMIGKAPVWGHFGLWDMNKSQMHAEIKGRSNTPEMAEEFLKARFNITGPEASAIYNKVIHLSSQEANNWLGPWPSFAIPYNPCTPLNETVICQSSHAQLTINLDNKTVSIGDGISPQVLVISINGTIYKTISSDSTAPYGVFYSSNENNAVIADPLLVDSMFMRLHFDKGAGLNRFKQFSYRRSVMGENIYVWKIDWGIKYD